MDPKLIQTINGIVTLLKEHKALIVQLQNEGVALKQAYAALAANSDSGTQFASAQEYQEAVLNSADEEAI